MKTLSALCICLPTLLIAACGDRQPSPTGQGKDPDQIAEEEFEIGDGIGAHGASLETRTMEHIKNLIAAGADPKKPHMIEHHLEARTIEMARSIVKWGNENGFTPTGFDESEVVPGEWILIDLVKPTKLELAELWLDSSRIADLAESLDCEYENWGCVIVE